MIVGTKSTEFSMWNMTVKVIMRLVRNAFGDVEGHYKMECLALRIEIIVVRPQKGLLYRL